MQNIKVLNSAIYVRVSTERQVLQGYSLEAQKENLTNFALSQGWSIFDCYADEGISGKNVVDRPEVKRLIEDIRLKRVDVVVLYKFDRLTRDSRDTEDFIELIQKYGILVYTLSGGMVDVSTPSGRFNTRILGAAAQFERETTIDRVVDGFIKKVKNGYSLCSATPSYGYDRPKHQEIQTINESEAAVVRRIFSLYIHGKTFTEICDILNSENIPTKNNGRTLKKRGTNEYYKVNSVWMPKTIRLILSNENYIGNVRYGVNREKVTLEEAADYKNRRKGFVAKGLHEAIIDKKTWDEAQTKLKKIKRVYRTNLPKEDVYYCGKLICGLCGHPLTTNRTNKRRKDGSTIVHNGYRCVNREKNLCSALGMSHKKVEKAFLQYIEKIPDLEDIEEMKPNNDSDDNIIELASLKKRVAQKNNKMKEIMKLFIDDRLEYNEYYTMKTSIEKEYAGIEKEIKRIESLSVPKKNVRTTKTIAKSIKEHWLYLTNQEKFEFLTQFVEKIVVVNKNKDKKNGVPEIIDIKFYED